MDVARYMYKVHVCYLDTSPELGACENIGIYSTDPQGCEKNKVTCVIYYIFVCIFMNTFVFIFIC